MKRRTLLKMLGAVLVGTGLAPLVSLGQRFQGEVSSTTIWRRALTDQEVKRLAGGEMISGAFTVTSHKDPVTGKLTVASLKREEDPWIEPLEFDCRP